MTDEAARLRRMEHDVTMLAAHFDGLAASIEVALEAVSEMRRSLQECQIAAERLQRDARRLGSSPTLPQERSKRPGGTKGADT